MNDTTITSGLSELYGNKVREDHISQPTHVCPKCGATMRQTGNLLLTYPAMVELKCPNCGAIGSYPEDKVSQVNSESVLAAKKRIKELELEISNLKEKIRVSQSKDAYKDMEGKYYQTSSFGGTSLFHVKEVVDFKDGTLYINGELISDVYTRVCVSYNVQSGISVPVSIVNGYKEITEEEYERHKDCLRRFIK